MDEVRRKRLARLGFKSSQQRQSASQASQPTSKKPEHSHITQKSPEVFKSESPPQPASQPSKTTTLPPKPVSKPPDLNILQDQAITIPVSSSSFSDVIKYLFSFSDFHYTITPSAESVASLLSLKLFSCPDPVTRLNSLTSVTGKFDKIPKDCKRRFGFLSNTIASTITTIYYCPRYFGLKSSSNIDAFGELLASNPNLIKLSLDCDRSRQLANQFLNHCNTFLGKNQSVFSQSSFLNQISLLLNSDYQLFLRVFPSNKEELLAKFNEISPIIALNTAFHSFNDNFSPTNMLNQFSMLKDCISNCTNFCRSLLTGPFKSNFLSSIWNLIDCLSPRQMLQPNVELPNDISLLSLFTMLSPLAKELVQFEGKSMLKVDENFLLYGHRFKFSTKRIGGDYELKMDSQHISFNLNTEIYFLLHQLLTITIQPIQRDLSHRHSSLSHARTRLSELPANHPMRQTAENRLKKEENEIDCLGKILSSPLVFQNCLFVVGLDLYFVRNLFGSDLCSRQFCTESSSNILPLNYLESTFNVLSNLGHLLVRRGYSNLLDDLVLVKSILYLVIDLSPLLGRTELPLHVRSKLVLGLSFVLDFDSVFVNHLLLNGSLSKILIKTLIEVFIAFENLDTHAAFFEKFPLREAISEIFGILHSNGGFLPYFQEVSTNQNDLLNHFITLLLNDIQYLIDDGLSKLQDTVESQGEHQNSTRAVRDQAMMLLKWGKSFLSLCAIVATYLPQFFNDTAIISRASNTLVFLVSAFTGSKAKTAALEVLDKASSGDNFSSIDLAFQSGNVLAALARVDGFDAKFAEDLYNTQCKSLLQFVELVSAGLRESQRSCLNELVEKVVYLEDFVCKKEKLSELAPDHYLDSLSYTLMDNPIRLPSGAVMDKSILSRHLLSDPRDPFTRSPLSLEDCEELDDLKREIKEWTQQQMNNLG
ncbi:hypothetical protein P9112_011104 [Eukaryota sp. TZLM1-RC]